MDLVIVESPSKAKTICKYLGPNYHVLASGGHVRDLPVHTLGVDVENNFEPQYEITAAKTNTIKTLKKEVSAAARVYLATDPDREGEAISWHLAGVLGLKDKNIRIEFNEISKRAVGEAIKAPREINMNLVDSQQARRVLDRLVGYKISPVLTRKVKNKGTGGLSGGRVQSVALKMIVDREREIRAFKPEEYWNIFAFISNDNVKVHKSAFNDINGKKFKVTNKQDADEIVNRSKEGNWSIDNVKRGESVSRPNAPYTTSTMQQDASSKLGYTSPQTMQIAQQLYEGVDFKGEPLALVTYIRTDSVRVSADAQYAAKDFITANFGKEYAPAQFNVYASKKSAQDAHEAIRPISVTVTPESLKDKIENRQYRLYKLIYERFMASQMTAAVYNTLSVHAVSESAGKKYGYSLKGKTLVFAGYTLVYSNQAEDDDATLTLPPFSEKDNITCKELKSEQKFTKPPARYTDSSLVKGMEENGIGRPSTYASTIQVLAKRTYTDKDGKSILPTELGEIVCDQLVKYFPDIIDAKFTARMEEKLDGVEDGGVNWRKIISDFYPGLIKQVQEASADGSKVSMKLEVSDVPCDKCGALMVVRTGKYGKFLACPNFPECKNIKSINEPAAKCPVCGGDIYKRVSKKGRPFFGCSNYPQCTFLCNDLPAPTLCPKCNGAMKQVKDGEKTIYKCINKSCGTEIANDNES